MPSGLIQWKRTVFAFQAPPFEIGLRPEILRKRKELEIIRKERSRDLFLLDLWSLIMRQELMALRRVVSGYDLSTDLSNGSLLWVDHHKMKRRLSVLRKLETETFFKDPMTIGIEYQSVNDTIASNSRNRRQMPVLDFGD